ncbi:hypothetical protein [Maricaulis maris]|uniref:Uncharacterized protein n=1 Tax=Maricaulis maris TaxID=74318 RepID=A0A495D1L9_9PROT|nr:hypothetical protein [Maricaulis maris]RKQ95455.1 hypothetical protein C7435_2557 [Maricaulis maris]
MADTPDITAFCPAGGDLPASLLRLFVPGERRSVGEIAANDHAALASPERKRELDLLVIGRRVAFMRQRDGVEGHIQQINREAGHALVTIATGPLRGITSHECLINLTPIFASGRPMVANPGDAQ